MELLKATANQVFKMKEAHFIALVVKYSM